MKDFYSRYLHVTMFYVFAWIIHIVLISIMTFFHFRLDHKLIIVENWIFDFAWSLNLISKLFSFVIFWKFFHDQKGQRGVIEKKEVTNIDSQVFIYSVVCLFILIWANKPRLIDNVLFSFSTTLLHFFTIFFVFILDILIFKVLVKPNDKFMLKDILFATATVSLYNFLIFPYIGLQGAGLTSLLLIGFCFFNFYERSILNTAMYIFLVICPMFTLFGNDPIWGGKFSTFIFSSNATIYYIVLSIIIFLFFTFKRRRTS